MGKSEMSKSKVIQMFKIGLLFDIELPYTTTLKPSSNTRNAAAITGGVKGLFMIQNERERNIEISTEIQFTPEGLLIKNAKGEGHHLRIKYTDIADAQLKRHEVKVRLINNMEFSFKTGLLIRAGIKRGGYEPEFVLQVLYDYLIEDWKHY